MGEQTRQLLDRQQMPVIESFNPKNTEKCPVVSCCLLTLGKNNAHHMIHPQHAASTPSHRWLLFRRADLLTD